MQRGGRTQFTESRIGAGVSLSGHSYSMRKEYAVDGVVSGIAQLQDVGRPGFDARANLLSLGLGAAQGATGYTYASRVADFEQRLDAIRDAREELELISKVVGRVRVVLVEWQANTTAEDGDLASYRLTLWEVQRAGLTIADAIDSALALNGSGGASNGGGASTTTPGLLTVVP